MKGSPVRIWASASSQPSHSRASSRLRGRSLDGAGHSFGHNVVTTEYPSYTQAVAEDGSQLSAAKIAAAATIAAAVIAGIVTVAVALINRGGNDGRGTATLNIPPTGTRIATTGIFPGTRASGAPSVFLNTVSGVGGSTIKVSGSGYAPNEEIVIRFHTDEVGSTTANSEGKFDNVVVIVPTSFSKFAPQQFNVIATGQSSLRSDEAPFTITG